MYPFSEIDDFLRERPLTNTNVSKFPKTGLWRVEFIKHNRTGMYTLRFGFSGYVPAEFKFYIKNKRLIVPGISDVYVEGDTFSIYSILCDSQEHAQNTCYDMADKYRNDELLVLPRSHSHFFKTLPQGLLEVIDGALAGDGTIIDTTEKAGMFLYQLGNKQFPHMQEFHETLQKFGYDGEIKTYFGKLNGEPYPFHSLTWFLRCLRPHRDRWYGFDRKKKLPDDVCNTPTFWRWFYAGDGCFQKSGAFSGHVTLCVNDFTTDEVERLQSMLFEHGIASKKWAMSKQGTPECPQWLIWMFGKNARQFLEMTSPPVRGLEYKWAIPDIPLYTCDFCLTEFEPYRADMKYCSPKCRDKGKPSRRKI